MNRIAAFVLLAPLVIAGLLMQLKIKPKVHQSILRISTGISFLLATLFFFVPLWLHTQHRVIPLHVSVDLGTAAFTAFCFLTALLCPVSLHFRREALMMLAIEICTLLALFTDHLLVFWVATMFAALPMVGDLRSQKEGADKVFLLFQVAGQVVLGAAFFSLYTDLPAAAQSHFFSIQQLVQSTSQGTVSQLTSGLFGLAILLRLGLFPFHPPILAVIKKARFSGMIVFLVSHLMLTSMRKFGGDWVSLMLHSFHGVLLSIMVLSAAYFALLSLTQNNLRQLMASQFLSFLCLGSTVIMGSPVGHARHGTTELLAICSIFCGLFSILWIVDTHMGVKHIKHYQGIAARSPGLATLFLLLALAGAGLPGTVGYIAEEVLLQQGFHHSVWQGIVLLLTMGCNAWVMFRCFARLFLGPSPSPSAISIKATTREKIALLCLVAFLFLQGFIPNIALH